MSTDMARRFLSGSGSAAILVLCGLLLPAAAGTDRLTLHLPDRTLAIPLSTHAGSRHLALEALAQALAGTVQPGPEGAIGLHWGGRRVRFTPNRREVSTSDGTAMLSAPARRQGTGLWLPVDAAAIAARERFGPDRVRWDASTRTLTVAGSAPEIRTIRVGFHPDRTRVVLEATRPVDWAVVPEGDGRLVVALPGSAMSHAIVRREYRVGLLRAVEAVQGPGGTQVRLAFAGRADHARWFALQDPFRIVVDLHRSAPSASTPGSAEPSGSPEGAGTRQGGPGAGAKTTAAAPRSAPEATGAAAGGASSGGMAGGAVSAAAPTGAPASRAAGATVLATRPAPPSHPVRPAAAPSKGAAERGGAGVKVSAAGTADAAEGVGMGARKAGAGVNQPAVLKSQGRPELPEAPPAAAPNGGGPRPPRSPLPGAAVPEAPPRPAPGGTLTIVIDPGHGGKDTGAVGPRGLKEKDVVLDIGLRLRRLLIDRLGARVIMTRSDDTFVPLEERTGIANRAHADFFISIHVNAAPQARATGVETYYLSRESSDISARASATRENLVLNLEGISPREQDSLKAVLWDMAETLHMQESSAMAEMLLENLGRGLRVETRGVKHGPFVVLMTAGMPSALVEVAFISNPNLERRLQEEKYRHSIAVALSDGVERFAHRYQRRLGMHRARPGPS